MKIVLVRHGEAEAARGNDAERALTANGVAQARCTAAWLLRQTGDEGGSLVLLSSPYRRAQQTAAVLGEYLRKPVLTLAEITPDVDPRRALQALEQHMPGNDWLIVVSHMPLLAALARWLEEGVTGSGRGFGLTEARVLEAETPGPGTAGLKAAFIPGLSG